MKIYPSSSAQTKNHVMTKKNNVAFSSHKLLREFDLPFYNGIKGYEYILGNLQKVLVVPMKGQNIGICTTVKVGSLNETEGTRGISHFLEHLIFLGSKSPDGKMKLLPNEISILADKHGADINANTSSACTNYIIDAFYPAFTSFSELLKAHATMIKYPDIPVSQFKKEKEVVTREINQSLNDISSRKYTGIVRRLFDVPQDANCLTLGTAENIKNMKLEDIYAHHQKYYVPNNLQTTIVGGDFSHQRIIQGVDKAFDTPDFRPREVIHYHVPPVVSKGITFDYYSTPKVKASSMYIAIPAPSKGNLKEYYAFLAAQMYLSRDKGSILDSMLLDIDASVSASHLSLSNNLQIPGLFNLGIPGLAPGNEQKALDIIKKAFKAVQDKPISRSELDKIKSNILYYDKKNYELAFSLDDTCVSEIIADSFYEGGIDDLLRQNSVIKSLTPNDVNNSIKKYFKIDNATVFVVQPTGKENKTLSFKGRNPISTKLITSKLLPNNIKLVINDDPNLLFTSIAAKLSSSNIKKTGVSTVLNSILNTSTAKYSMQELPTVLSDNNISISNLMNTKGIAFLVESEKENFLKALKLLKEILFAPALNAETFKLAKSEIGLDIKGKQIRAFARAKEEMYGNHPFGASDRKILENLDNLTLQDVLDYYKALTNNSSFEVVVSGPFSAGKNILKDVETALSDIDIKFNPKKIAQMPFTPPKKNICVVHQEPSALQSEINQIFNAGDLNIKEMAAYNVISEILGSGLNSRLFLDLREKQKLAYQVDARKIKVDHPSLETFALSIKTDIKTNGVVNSNIEKSLDGFKKHLKLLMSRHVTPQELQNAKKILTNLFRKNLIASADRSSALIVNLEKQYGINHTNKLVSAIGELTQEDIMSTARKIFTRPSVVSIVTSPEAIAGKTDYLSKIGELKIF